MVVWFLIAVMANGSLHRTPWWFAHHADCDAEAWAITQRASAVAYTSGSPIKTAYCVPLKVPKS